MLYNKDGKKISAEQVAEKLQTAYCNRKGNDYFCVSHILGSDWRQDFNSSAEGYKQEIIRKAEAIYGGLPWYPF